MWWSPFRVSQPWEWLQREWGWAAVGQAFHSGPRKPTRPHILRDAHDLNETGDIAQKSWQRTLVEPHSDQPTCMEQPPLEGAT